MYVEAGYRFCNFFGNIMPNATIKIKSGLIANIDSKSVSFLTLCTARPNDVATFLTAVSRTCFPLPCRLSSCVYDCNINFFTVVMGVVKQIDANSGDPMNKHFFHSIYLN